MPTLDETLHRHLRRRRPWYRQRAIVASLLLHLVAAGAAIWGPSLFATKAPPPTFVSIQIVPAAALGQRNPPPAPAPTPKVEETRPAPEVKPQAKTPTPAENRPAPVTKSATAPERPEPEPAPVREIPTDGGPAAREGSPQGSPMASGSSAEISGFDDPDFTYGYYADLMLSRIREQWERPPLGGDIELIVHFRVRRDGSVSDLKILRSSGYNSFDRAGLQAIERAQMPPLPKSYRPSSLGVRIRVH